MLTLFLSVFCSFICSFWKISYSVSLSSVSSVSADCDTDSSTTAGGATSDVTSVSSVRDFLTLSSSSSSLFRFLFFDIALLAPLLFLRPLPSSSAPSSLKKTWSIVGNQMSMLMLLPVIPVDMFLQVAGQCIFYST